METHPENKRILVVDDDKGVRQAYAKSLGPRSSSTVLAQGASLFGGQAALQPAGGGKAYDLTLTAGGAEAIAKIEAAMARAAPFAVAFIDMNMPRMDGAATANALWRRDPNLKIVIVTAYSAYSPEDIIQRVGREDIFYLRKPFNPEEIRQFARALLRQWNLEQEKNRLDRELAEARAGELDTAARIQQRLLFGRPPAGLDGFSVGHLAVPSQWVGGDFYDFILQARGILDVVVGDVMGKGVPAALVGAAVKAGLLRAVAEERAAGRSAPPAPEAIVTRVHAALIDQLEALETFVTLCYLRFDTSAGRLSCIDCGHVKPVLVSAANGSLETLAGTNLPLGFPEVGPFRETTAPFASGDMLFIYSDGLTEAAGADGELFGENRLTASIERYRSKNPAALIQAVHQDIVRFTGREDFSDDFTAVAIQATPTGTVG
jgi:phosphoserine phosphatase RsbU/P